MKKRKILFVTGSRGEYGYIRPLLKLMRKSNSLEPKVCATNMHMLPEFGNSINAFHSDAIPVNHEIYMTLAGYTNVTMVKSYGVLMLSIADILHNDRPGIILLAGDRGEQLAAAIAGANMNIPVAHIQGGELSGNIDGMTRHAISRFAHIHFVSNKDAENRLLKMGEEPFRVLRVGAPQLDEFVQNKITSKEIIAKNFMLDLTKPLLLVVQHPVTEQVIQAEQQMIATMNAIISIGIQAVVIYPNDDAGSIAIQECIQKHRHVNIRTIRNTSREDYAGLMNLADVIVGNSSSGIIEAPFFKLPAVNIGRRQEGRLQAANVINVPNHDQSAIGKAIKKALTKEFIDSIKNVESPYGDGHSSKRIIKVLETIKVDEKLLYKEITY